VPSYKEAVLDLLTNQPDQALTFFQHCKEIPFSEKIYVILKMIVAEHIEGLKTAFDTKPSQESIDASSCSIKKMKALGCLSSEGVLPETFTPDLIRMELALAGARAEKRCIDLIIGSSEQDAGLADSRAHLRAIGKLKRELRYESKLIEGVSPSVVAALDLLEETLKLQSQESLTFDNFLRLPERFPLNFFEDQLEGARRPAYIEALHNPLESCITAAYTKTRVPNEWTKSMVDQLEAFYQWADSLPSKGLPNISLLIEFESTEEAIHNLNQALNDPLPFILPSMVWRRCAIALQHKKTSLNPLPDFAALIPRLRQARYPHNQNPREILEATARLESLATEPLRA